MFENGHRPQAVIMVPGTLELDLTSSGFAAHDASSEDAISVRRRAA
jgi:hypothetical protein